MPEDPTTPTPLLTHIEVKGFQSLHHVSLPLAPFTVIVGPSSSGKSSLTRALRTLAHNSRGTSYVTHGFPRTVISADIGHPLRDELQGTLTLTRSATSSKAHDNAYVIAPPPGPHEDAPESVYTRLNGEVPEEVQDFLALPRDPQLTFAAQFDKPYLLDASPQEVARTLAQLTSVHVILDAAREANRQRLTHAQTLRTRTTDLEAIRLRAEEFRTLAGQRKAQTLAEIHLDRAHALNAKIATLRSIIKEHWVATETIETFRAHATAQIPDLAPVEVMTRNRNFVRREAGMLLRAVEALTEAHKAAHAPEADYQRVFAAATAWQSYRAVLVRLRNARLTITRAGNAHTDALLEETNALEEYADALRSSHTCPTCGQDTTHLNADDLEKIHA